MSDYIHGTAPGEQQRLSKLNTLMNAGSLREMAPRRGERILEVGSGLGQFARDMARAAGTQVVGIEFSGEQIAEAQRQAAATGEAHLVEFREGDAANPPLRAEEWGTFDAAHARFLLEHVPDPLAVVRAMVRAVRPGGRIVLEDDDHDVIRLWPEPPGFRALWDAYMRAYEVIGRDPIVGRRLVELLHAAGATPVRNSYIFFGTCTGDTNYEAFVANLIGVISTARERMIAHGLITAAAFDSAIAAMREWQQRPDAAIWFPIAWAEGQAPHR